jgi:hypothetical protein
MKKYIIRGLLIAAALWIAVSYLEIGFTDCDYSVCPCDVLDTALPG